MEFWVCERRIQINFRLQTRLHSSIFRSLALYGSIECASRQILITKIAARDIAPENLLKTGKFGETSNSIVFTWDFHLNWQCPNFLFCEWRMQINFRFQTRLHNSVFRFLALYGSIECANRQILISKIVARDMDFRCFPIFRKFSIFFRFSDFPDFRKFSNFRKNVFFGCYLSDHDFFLRKYFSFIFHFSERSRPGLSNARSPSF